MLKVCCSCKVEKLISDFYRNGSKVNGEPKYNSWCKECRKEKMKVSYKEGNKYSLSIASKREKSVRSYLSYLLNKSKTRKSKENNLFLDHLCFVYESQNGLCALSKRKLSHKINDVNSMSVDRINPSKGYIVGNIQLVTKQINKMKWDLTQEEFINLCGEVFNVQKL